MRILVIIFGFLCSLAALMIGIYLLCSPVHAEYVGFYQPNKFNCGYDENCKEWNQHYSICVQEKNAPFINENPNHLNNEELEEIYRNAYVQCMANFGHNLSN
jgi:hypothetical protein